MRPNSLVILASVSADLAEALLDELALLGVGDGAGHFGYVY
jgi:energy-converting hydrogenase Eha subunit G